MSPDRLCPKCSAEIFLRAGLSEQGHVEEEYCRICGWDRPVKGELRGAGDLVEFTYQPLRPYATSDRRPWMNRNVNNPWGRRGKSGKQGKLP